MTDSHRCLEKPHCRSAFPHLPQARRRYTNSPRKPFLKNYKGWLHDQEKSRSLLSSCRRGGVVQEFLDHTTPSAPSKEASLLLLDVAATPPPAEEGSRLRQLSKGPRISRLRQWQTRADVQPEIATDGLRNYTRLASGEWVYSDITNPEGFVELSSIACQLSPARIYRIF